MDIGVVLQTTPPASRVVDLAVRAETYGFSHVWTFDSHILWEEPFVIYSQILDRTRNVTVGPMVTNPATRDWTVTASLFATLNEMYGNRTVCGIGRGDSAVRVTNGKPTTLATLREAIGVIRGLANGEAVDYKGSTLRFPWAGASRLEAWVAAYGPKALALTGEVGDGFILQLADPSIAEWTIERGPEGRRRRRPRPRGADDLRGRARLRHRRHARGPGPRSRPGPLVRRDGRQPRGRHRRPLRRRRAGPQGPHRVHRRAPGLRLQHPRPGRQRPRRLRVRRHRRPLLPASVRSRSSCAAWPSCATSGSTSSPSTSSTTTRTRPSATTARRSSPASTSTRRPRRDRPPPATRLRRARAAARRRAVGGVQGDRREPARVAAAAEGRRCEHAARVDDARPAGRAGGARLRGVGGRRGAEGRLVHVPARHGRPGRRRRCSARRWPR